MVLTFFNTLEKRMKKSTLNNYTEAIIIFAMIIGLICSNITPLEYIGVGIVWLFTIINVAIALTILYVMNTAESQIRTSLLTDKKEETNKVRDYKLSKLFIGFMLMLIVTIIILIQGYTYTSFAHLVSYIGTVIALIDMKRKLIDMDLLYRT
jgi:uncharacterized membrane protein